MQTMWYIQANKSIIMKITSEQVREGKLSPKDYKCPMCGSPMKVGKNFGYLFKCNWGLCKSRKYGILWFLNGEAYSDRVDLSLFQNTTPIGSLAFKQSLDKSTTRTYNLILFKLKITINTIHNYNGKYLGDTIRYSVSWK